MSAEDRLSRALAAPVAPAKDMHFTLQVMRQAEAARFKAETGRRLLRGAALAALAVAALLPLGGWAAENADAALDLGLAVGGVVAVLSVLRGLRRGAPARAR
ncbi:MAG TPA: hypothetical protein PLK37_09590 [Terricaulis sp.]|nr:hypothetical protein [Terricaulis sp.]